MNEGAKTVVIVTLLLLLCAWLRRDYIKGLAFGVFLCVSMPTFLRIEMPGALPQLTIHRLVLLTLFVFWLRRKAQRSEIPRPPLLLYLGVWSAVNFASLIFTDASFVTSLKRFLDFTLEVYAFYFLAATSLRGADDVKKVFWAALLGLAVVSVVGIIERYTGFNPVETFLAPGTTAGGGIQSTFQHRILMGTAMAMACPLALGLMYWADGTSALSRRFLWICLGLFFAACYFAQSRGPWLACGLACALVAFLGSPELKKKAVLIAALGVFALMLRPGVFDTLQDRAANTVDGQSFKGGTFRYRLELWKVAWNEISKSPVRFLIGYGPGSGSEKEFEWDVSYREQTLDIWSWDNHFAYDLFQSGCLGFFATVALYAAILKALYSFWKQGTGGWQNCLAGVLASATALVFMMTNVLIFSKQLDYLFWTLVAGGYCLGRHCTAQEVPAAREDLACDCVLQPPSFSHECMIRATSALRIASSG